MAALEHQSAVEEADHSGKAWVFHHPATVSLVDRERTVPAEAACQAAGRLAYENLVRLYVEAVEAQTMLQDGSHRVVAELYIQLACSDHVGLGVGRIARLARRRSVAILDALEDGW